MVIKHWLIHNLIQKDRYHPTRFQEEKSTLFIKENKAYTDNPDSVNRMLPEVRLGKDRLLDAEIRVEEETPRKKADTTYRVVFDLWGKYPLNWRANRTEIAAAQNLLSEHGLEKCRVALAFFKENKERDMCPQILKPSDLDRKWVNLQAFRDKR